MDHKYRVYHEHQLTSQTPRDRTDTQPLGHGSHYAYDHLDRARLSMQQCPISLQKAGVTGDTVELSPGSAPRMPIGSDVTLPDPAVIGTRFCGTVLKMGGNRSRTPALGDDPGRRCRRRRGDVLLILLTGLAVGLMGQAGKKLVGLWHAFGLLNRRVLRRPASLASHIDVHSQVLSQSC
jgi:hypothetical protein